MAVLPLVMLGKTTALQTMQRFDREFQERTIAHWKHESLDTLFDVIDKALQVALVDSFASPKSHYIGPERLAQEITRGFATESQLSAYMKAKGFRTPDAFYEDASRRAVKTILGHIYNHDKRTVYSL